MKLQLALDVLSLEDALALTRAAEEWVDRVELGTPFLLEYGMEAVRRFRAAFPYKELLADTKIMDAGRLEAECWPSPTCPPSGPVWRRRKPGAAGWWRI